MNIRQEIQRRPGVAAVLAVALIAAGIGLSIFLRSGNASGGGSSGLAWFTDDDGKTWFADDARRLPPFDHHGKTASRAFVFECTAHQTKFVAYLQRFTPEAQRAVGEAQAASDSRPESFNTVQVRGVEVKLPGSTQWVSVNSPEGARIRDPVCPRGDRENLTDVQP
jgi:hypothetical protein